MSAPTVIPAEAGDVQQLAYVIATAFRDLAPSRWLVDDEHARVSVLAAVFTLHIEHAMQHGTVYTTPGRDAAAVWLPVPATGPTQDPDYPHRLADAAGPWLSRFAVFDAVLDAAHPTGRAHEHLALLAVHPARQGRGVGRALLTAHHERLDRQQVAAYLEASDEHTESLYERHGYAPLPRRIELPGGPVMHPMWRDPVSAFP